MAFEMESSTGSFSYGVSDGFLVYSPRDAPDHQGLICEHDRFQPLERLAACTSVLPKDWRGVIDPIQLQVARVATRVHSRAARAPPMRAP